ncbi:MAG: hypothetical protein M3Z01_03225 [Thermoproteota archaeon]|nr:hypothetical protein [Thermoproteota archaeon]
MTIVARKSEILGILIIFGLTIIITLILTSYSTSRTIKPDLFKIYSVRNISDSSSSHKFTQSTDGNKNNVKAFTLVQDEFGFNGSTPGPSIQVNKGDIVKISIINDGAMYHNFGIGKPSNFTMALMKNISGLSYSEKIQKIPYDVLAKLPCPGCSPKFEKGHVKEFIKPGELVVTTFNASDSGKFKYFCMVRGHIWLGMNGDFIVNEINPLSLKNKGVNTL